MLVSLYFFKIKFVQNNSFGYPCYLLNYRIFALALPGPQSSQFRKKKDWIIQLHLALVQLQRIPLRKIKVDGGIIAINMYFCLLQSNITDRTAE